MKIQDKLGSITLFKSATSVAVLVCMAAHLAGCGRSQSNSQVTENGGEKGIIGKLLDSLKPIENELPAGFESQNGCQKREALWEKVQESLHTEPSQFRSVDITALFVNFLKIKISHISDQAPRNYKKGIHAVGTVAKVRYVSIGNHDLTGFFKDEDVCGLLRLSLTSKPGDVAPGLALKLFADGRASANISALVSLDGQAENHNFFAQDMTNIVGPSKKLTGGLSSHLFNLVSKHPRKLSVSRFSAYDSSGISASKPLYPYQVYFVPPEPVRSLFSPQKHDVMSDLRSINLSAFPGNDKKVVYEVWAVVPEDNSATSLKTHMMAITSDQENYKTTAQKIGELRLESDMTSSRYGDDLLFFLHDRFENE